MSDASQYSPLGVILNVNFGYRRRSGTGLTRCGVAVLAAIKRVKVQFVSLDDLVTRSGFSRSTVIKSIKDLEALGYIRVTRTAGFDNQYEVLRGAK